MERLFTLARVLGIPARRECRSLYRHSRHRELN